MENSVKTELANYIIELINDEVLTNDNQQDWHYHAFNEDYYIIGYYNASEWLKKHDIDPFEAVGICNDYEIENFGECSGRYDNPETTVNMLSYIFGEEFLNNSEAETVEELIEYCEQF